MSVLAVLTDKLSKLLKYITFVMLAVMVCIITAQVFFRYVVGTSLSWSEEMARFLFVWIVLLGAANGVKENYHVVITAITNRLPEKAAKIVNIIDILLIMVVALCMTVYGYQMAMKAAGHLSAAMRISTLWQYIPVPISGIAIILFSLEKLIESFRDWKGDKA